MKNIPTLSLRLKMYSFFIFCSSFFLVFLYPIKGNNSSDQDSFVDNTVNRFENTYTRFLNSDSKLKNDVAYQNAEGFFKAEEFVFALYYYNYLAAQPEKKGLQFSKAEINDKRVICLTQLRRYDDAINVVKQTLMNDTGTAIETDAYLKLMNLFSLKEEIDSALFYKQLTENEILSKENRKRFTSIKLHIIKTCIQNKNYNLGLRLLNDLKDELVVRKESRFLAIYYHLYALIYMHNDDVKNAQLYFEKGRNIASKLRDLQLITEILVDEVSMNLSKGNFGEAQKGIQKLHTYSRYVPKNLARKIVILEAKLNITNGNKVIVNNALDSLASLNEGYDNKALQSEIIQLQDAILICGELASENNTNDEGEGGISNNKSSDWIISLLFFFFLIYTVVLIFLLFRSNKKSKRKPDNGIGSFVLESLRIQKATDDLVQLFEKTLEGGDITDLCPEKRRMGIQNFLKSNEHFYHFSEFVLKNNAIQPVLLLKKLINAKLYCYIFLLPGEFQDKKNCNDDIEMLRKLNKTKNKLFSMIGHELRNAIGNSKAVLETLSEDLNMYGEENLQQVIDMLKNASIKAYEMLENLLYWSRIQRQEMKYQPESLSVKMLLSEILNSLTPQAADKNIDIENTIYSDSLLYVDEQMSLLVLSNILSNAIKFTNEKGKVRISGKHLENKFIFEISDNGVGIKDEDISKIFDENELFSTYGTAGEKGLGIGIFICSKLVEEHGGNLTIESKNNEGTVVTFSFPVNE